MWLIKKSFDADVNFIGDEEIKVNVLKSKKKEVLPQVATKSFGEGSAVSLAQKTVVIFQEETKISVDKTVGIAKGTNIELTIIQIEEKIKILFHLS